jgi:hypothetical protein
MRGFESLETGGRCGGGGGAREAQLTIVFILFLLRKEIKVITDVVVADGRRRRALSWKYDYPFMVIFFLIIYSQSLNQTQRDMTLTRPTLYTVSSQIECSIVIPSADNLLHSRSKQNSVFLQILVSPFTVTFSARCVQIGRSWTLVGRITEDSLARCLVIPNGSTDERTSAQVVFRMRSLTASRYLLSPTRSRYLRQNGSVPKFLLIDFSSDFADVSLRKNSGDSLHEQ